MMFLLSGAMHSEKADLVVALDGTGNFRSIQQAIDSRSSSADPLMILIKNGTYNEKVFIRRSNVSLVGEHRDSTRIVFAELREEWNAVHDGSDWGAGVVNIDTGVADITIANLTIYNNYGAVHGVYNKHQFAIRGAGTRIILLDCNVVSDGGDALSLWNKQDGMYYHNNCHFEGWVDFVCPRGWCYITNSTFYGHNKPSASIWHDGSEDRNQKFVINHSMFDGVPGFPLGRNHLDAQFYLVYCRFSENMADRPFYRPPSSPREWQWGARHYFHGCRRDGGDFAWFADNLHTAEGAPTADQITAKWTFDGKWDPESSLPSILPHAFFPSPRNMAVINHSAAPELTWIPGRNTMEHNVYFGVENPPQLAVTTSVPHFNPGRLAAATTYYWRVDEVTSDGIIEGRTWTFSTGGGGSQ